MATDIATVMTEVTTACAKHGNVKAEVATACAKHGNVKAKVTTGKAEVATDTTDAATVAALGCSSFL